MKLTGNTVLITGGTSGIGFEMARQLIARGNVVIVTGLDGARMADAVRTLPGLHAYRSDVGDPAAIDALRSQLEVEFPALNVLVNNAGLMRMIDLNESNGTQAIGRELEVDLLGPVRMVDRFLPLLLGKENAAVLNVSSGLAFVPLASAPVYSAAKAGLHAYTQSLRAQLRGRGVRVFELAPPPTRTALLDGFGSDSLNGSSRGTLTVQQLVVALLRGMERDQEEIVPGISAALRLMSRLAPGFIRDQVGKSSRGELARLRKGR